MIKSAKFTEAQKKESATDTFDSIGELVDFCEKEGGFIPKHEIDYPADIIDKGIVLTGGGALVDGFAQVLSQELKVPVFTAESPLTCVAEGTGILLDNLYMLERQ